MWVTHNLMNLSRFLVVDGGAAVAPLQALLLLLDLLDLEAVPHVRGEDVAVLLGLESLELAPLGTLQGLAPADGKLRRCCCFPPSTAALMEQLAVVVVPEGAYKTATLRPPPSKYGGFPDNLESSLIFSS